MKVRKAIKIKSSADGRRHIYVDAENAKAILAYIEQDARHEKKWKHICELILNRHRNCDLYDKENINSQCQDVTAMKFFKGQENDRIYCKEVSKNNQTFIVVAAELHFKKKSNKLSDKEKQLIQTVSKYEYDLR